MEFKLDKKVSLPEAETDFLAVGELLVDLIAREETGSFAQVETYRRHFGGSPANIAINVRNLGCRSALISRIGADGLGDFLIRRLNLAGVNADGIIRDEKNNTSLMLVTRSRESPEFLAYRGADRCLKPEDVKSERIAGAGIVHISTFAISAAESRRALEKVVRISRDRDRVLALDPNYRPQLWEGEFSGQEYIRKLLSDVAIVKPSLDDARALFGPGGREEHLRRFHEAGCDLVIFTLGADGLIVSTAEEQRYYPSLADEVVDTTGAGDAFWGGFYGGIIKGQTLHEAVKLGSALAAEALKKVGAMVEIPEEEWLNEKYDLNLQGR